MLSSISNCYEQLVIDELFRVFRDAFGRDPEQDLLEDIACLALNQLPPRYVRHSVDLAAHLSSEDGCLMQDQVVTAVASAIATVKRRQNGER